MPFDSLAARTAILQRFPSLRVLVVGDLMLDRYMWGSVERVSPEAPVPVVHLQRESASLGGAANVANNLVHLGAKTSLAGLVGDDKDGQDLVATAEELSIDTGALTKTDGYKTTTKTRVFASHQQMLRIDREAPPKSANTDKLLSNINRELEKDKFDAVILSDYAKGVCTPDFCQGLIAICREKKTPVYVDPKGTDYDKYRGATSVKPNKAEMRLLAQRLAWPDHDLANCAELLRNHLGLKFVAVTLGGEGILVVDETGADVLPAQARDVFDVSGAGDTVISTMVLALAAGLPVRTSVALSNMAAAIVVAKLGSTPIERDDLLLAIQGKSHESRRKHFSNEDLRALLHAWRASGEKIVLTNGCFDLLHAGHIQFLEEASKLGDRLIVAINSDASVTKVKGPGRPVLPEAQRISLLAALEAVDAIVVYDEDRPDTIIEMVRPNVLVKGSNHEKSTIAGADFIESYGGEVRTIPVLEGLKTAKFAAALD